MSTPLVYEVTLDIDAGAATEFDAWLKEHVREMLALPGFHDARILKPEGAEPGSERRVVQYTLGSRAELDHYVAEHAPRMREDGVRRFGDKMKASRRVFDLDIPAAGTLSLPGLVLPPEGPRCRNCGTPLTGKFCMECGQKNHTYVAPLWNVLHDFAATHFGFDTKFFHSIVPLLFRPGFLSREYCLGHEERYVKPFRLYLFTSIVFFFLAAIFWPQLGVDDGSRSDVHTKLPIGSVVHKQDPDVTRAAVQKALQQIDIQPIDPERKAFARSVLEQELAALNVPAAASKALVAVAGGTTQKAAPVAAIAPPKVAVPPAISGGFDIKTGDADVGTIHVNTKGGGKAETDNRFEQMFNNVRDHQDEFKKRFIQNLPKLMFVLMPLIALFLKLFYIGSKRYLTEHFVFTLHYHCLVFVVLLLVMLAGSLGRHFIWAAPLKSAGTVAGWYIAVYLFLALRFFYRQGWFMTSLKFFMLTISYIVAFSLTFLAGVMLTAAEIGGPTV
ncbi:MAG TPA: DUF4286 family protein [Gammaproteobacteria bacterium]|jgi:hypothetical protein|nr:DUF4286 family protein [Gammaproteobacteria bacterium]